jgi:hypothetical protein
MTSDDCGAFVGCDGYGERGAFGAGWDGKEKGSASCRFCSLHAAVNPQVVSVQSHIVAASCIKDESVSFISYNFASR